MRILAGIGSVVCIVGRANCLGKRIVDRLVVGGPIDRQQRAEIALARIGGSAADHGLRRNRAGNACGLDVVNLFILQQEEGLSAGVPEFRDNDRAVQFKPVLILRRLPSLVCLLISIGDDVRIVDRCVCLQEAAARYFIGCAMQSAGAGFECQIDRAARGTACRRIEGVGCNLELLHRRVGRIVGVILSARHAQVTYSIDVQLHGRAMNRKTLGRLVEGVVAADGESTHGASAQFGQIERIACQDRKLLDAGEFHNVAAIRLHVVEHVRVCVDCDGLCYCAGTELKTDGDCLVGQQGDVRLVD